jgi:hypothetical protein
MNALSARAISGHWQHAARQVDRDLQRCLHAAPFVATELAYNMLWKHTHGVALCSATNSATCGIQGDADVPRHAKNDPYSC